MRKLFLISTLLFLGFHLKAQDIHFSQFNVAPMVYNPANTGFFDGDVRFIGNQRTQWRSVTTPYNTVGGSVDFRNAFGQNGVGAGLSIYQDRAGDSRLNTLAINGAGSYELAASIDSTHRFHVGIQLGFTQRKIDYSALTYDSQWNGFSYDPSLSPNETFARDARGYFNVNFGFGWRYVTDRRHQLEAGIALHNANGPDQSFFDDPSITLDRRVSLTAFGIWEVADEWDALGGILLSRQRMFTEFIPGGGARYILMDNELGFRTIFGGIFWRTRDAGYILAGMDYDEWRFGISYDINTSNLRPASNGRGGLEFSVVYILAKEKPKAVRRRLCREFF